MHHCTLFHSTHHAYTNTLKWRAQSNWKLSHSRLSLWFAFPLPNGQFIQVQLQLKYVYNFISFFLPILRSIWAIQKTDLSRVPCQAVKLIAWIRLLLLLFLLLLAKWAPGLPTHYYSRHVLTINITNYYVKQTFKCTLKINANKSHQTLPQWPKNS